MSDRSSIDANILKALKLAVKQNKRLIKVVKDLDKRLRELEEWRERGY